MILLRFVSHPGIFNWAARIAQYGFWCTHVEAVCPDGSLLGAMSDGVLSRPNGYDKKAFLREEFVTVEASETQADKFHGFLLDQIGKPYDRLAIISFFFARDWQEPDSWDCSELIAAGLAACGIFPQHMAVEFSHITPRDLMLLISTARKQNG